MCATAERRKIRRGSQVADPVDTISIGASTGAAERGVYYVDI